MLKPHHVHYYIAKTTMSSNHFHQIEGYTRTVNGNGYDGHYHLYRGITSFENKHYHRYYGKTGPAIALPDGTHYHEIAGRTYFNYDQPLPTEYGGVIYDQPNRPKHDHNYQGATEKGTGYEPGFDPSRLG
ncbi:YmaF family protein [Metabacillus herbersteinensis]|uniref:YmaF family protein n=1 Tax=Metabacillus herbersteinensis TaxID=283816 RepID=A0ABV6GG77_9BACI